MKKKLLTLNMQDVIQRVLALSAAGFTDEAVNDGSPRRAVLTDDHRLLLAMLGWDRMRRLCADLNGWLGSVETHGTGDPDGEMCITLVTSRRWQETTLNLARELATDCAAHGVLELLDSGKADSDGSFHHARAEEALQGLKNLLRGADARKRYKIKPHWY